MRIYRFPLVLASWSIRHPGWVLLWCGIISVVSGILAQRLALHNDLVELLPAKMEQVQTIRRILKETGGLGIQAVVVHSPDKQKNQAFLKDLYDALKKKTLPTEAPLQKDQKNQEKNEKKKQISLPLVRLLPSR